MGDIPKKTSVAILLIAIVVSVIFTLVILNQTPKGVVKADVPKESVSGGEVSLKLIKPEQKVDESSGSVNLKVLPQGGG